MEVEIIVKTNCNVHNAKGILYNANIKNYPDKLSELTFSGGCCDVFDMEYDENIEEMYVETVYTQTELASLPELYPTNKYPNIYDGGVVIEF